MIIALLQIQSTGSRRALVVFSDGLDTSSVFSAGDVAEVARRSGVPVYVLCLAPAIGPQGPRSGRNAVMVPSAHEIVYLAQRSLKNLSRSSGGKAFDLQSLDELESIWGEIGEDLRRQSLVIYRTKPVGSEWRPLEVALKGGGRLRAPSGVYVASHAPEEREVP